jgi:hypothetical protein
MLGFAGEHGRGSTAAIAPDLIVEVEGISMLEITVQWRFPSGQSRAPDRIQMARSHRQLE